MRRVDVWSRQNRFFGVPPNLFDRSKEPAINPSLSHLALQLSWSAQYLQWRLDVERRAVNDEQLRQITSGALNSVLALRAVAPSKHAAMLDEAAGALRRVADDL